MLRLLLAVALGSFTLAASPVALVGAESSREVFPGRNGEIVFTLHARYRVAGSIGFSYPDLYLVRSNGSKLRRVTRARGADFAPKWSPDGKWIAYVSDRSRPRNESAWEIYLMRANGAGLRRVTRNRFPDYDLAWAPDGTRLVFVSTPSATSGLWVMNVNGTGLRRLTGNAGAPAWSPDGATIAIERPDSTFRSNAIWLMNADGEDQRRLTVPPENPGNESYGTDGRPAWSPDGKRIAFVRHYRGRTDIYAIRANGTGLRRLTKGIGQHSSPAWSPDGRRIVFVTSRYQRSELSMMNADGTNQRRLSTGLGIYGSPEWQPLSNR